MIEFEIRWCQCPHVQHTHKVLFVEAKTPDDAREIARDHIKRTFAIDWFTIFTCQPAKPVPAGKVLNTGEPR